MKGKWFIAALLLFFSISLLWFFYPIWVSKLFSIPEENDALVNLGVFGDSFGSLNTLFSGLAFSGILLSIYLQSKELSETRKEIKLQREQFKSQTEIMDRQAFENTFFQLLKLLNENVNNLILVSNNNEVSGRPLFKLLYKKLHNKEHLIEYGIDSNESITFKNHYNYFIDLHGVLLLPYFETLLRALLFLETSKYSCDEFYTCLLRSQFSNYESALIFYHCLSEHGESYLKPLIEKYSMLQGLGNLDEIENHEIVMFNIKAFGSNPYFLSAFEIA